MDETTQIINRVLPILFLIFLGYWIRRVNFLAESTIEDLRKIAVNLALPAVLFTSFLQIQLKSAYFVIFGLIFALCVGLFWLGQWLKRRLNLPYTYFPFLMTGFEYGMLGISLFGSAYGLEKIGYIAIVDLGHEIFIWFVFLALLLMKRDGLQKPTELVQSFFKSPVIIAILLGILLNIVGAQEALCRLPITGALMATLQFLGNLTIPIILIIVGYGIKLDRYGIKEALLVVAIRLIILIPLALILNTFVIGELLHLEKPFAAALFTLLILPPPFIIPLYMRPDVAEEKRYINNVLTLYTVISIAIYTVYFILNPQI
ncbi:MAG: auxin efflux carrier [Chloroflexota bacterium]|nr:MAG: auxin efflux carrier [Chloroflexota bacterium]